MRVWKKLALQKNHKTRVASAGYYNFSAVIETFIAASTTKEHINNIIYYIFLWIRVERVTYVQIIVDRNVT